MIGYASNTGTHRNLDTLRKAGWGILLTPDNPTWRDGFHHVGVDNGAWKAFKQNKAFDGYAFQKLVDRHGPMADFVVIPDIVAGGYRSLEFSLSWMPKLRGLRRLLLPVQDGMHPNSVWNVLREWSNCGIFLGGSTEWKLKSMWEWGMLACASRRYYHVGRINTCRRIRLVAEAGADSFDGTSATMFSCNVPMLTAAKAQPSLLVPSMSMRWP